MIVSENVIGAAPGALATINTVPAFGPAVYVTDACPPLSVVTGVALKVPPALWSVKLTDMPGTPFP